ncbi:MAG: TauD/TfdA family dioxygenase [Hyphomicrobiales bacterium]
MNTVEIRSNSVAEGGLGLRNLAAGELSRPSRLDGFPLVIEADGDAPADLVDAVARNADRVRGHLFDAGAVLLRGFHSASAGDFEAALAALGLNPTGDYLFGIAKRERHSGAAFTSTTWSKRAILPPHTEMAYMRRRPSWIAFYCAAPASRYGETPCFDMAAAYRALPSRLAELLRDATATYTRRIPKVRGRFGYQRTVAETFGTEDRDEISTLCKDLDVIPRWIAPDLLEAVTHVDAVVRHPSSGALCLNAQFTEPAAFRYLFRRFADRFTLSERCLQEALLFGAGLVRGGTHQSIRIDGRRLAARDVRTIYDCMFGASAIFEWRRGDLLLLDNIRSGHGRLNVVGPRQILTCFGDPYDV